MTRRRIHDRQVGRKLGPALTLLEALESLEARALAGADGAAFAASPLGAAVRRVIERAQARRRRSRLEPRRDQASLFTTDGLAGE